MPVIQLIIVADKGMPIFAKRTKCFFFLKHKGFSSLLGFKILEQFLVVDMEAFESILISLKSAFPMYSLIAKFCSNEQEARFENAHT